MFSLLLPLLLPYSCLVPARAPSSESPVVRGRPARAAPVCPARHRPARTRRGPPRRLSGDPVLNDFIRLCNGYPAYPNGKSVFPRARRVTCARGDAARRRPRRLHHCRARRVERTARLYLPTLPASATGRSDPVHAGACTAPGLRTRRKHEKAAHVPPCWVGCPAGQGCVTGLPTRQAFLSPEDCKIMRHMRHVTKAAPPSADVGWPVCQWRL